MAHCDGKNPRLRKRTQRLLALIENDMLAKLGREPDQIDRDLIREMAKLALGIHIDAVCGVRCQRMGMES